jgi:hypothetical protein
MRTTLPLLALAAFIVTSTAHANELLMEQADRPQAQSYPQGGMTMMQVSTQFGDPSQKLTPVGNPPITRWIYDGYTVYFEHDLVVHSVAARP